MNNATIFYNERQLLDGQPCFDSRFEGQGLPAGSVVVGFIVARSEGGQELLDPPYMQPAQEANYQAVLQETRDVLAG